MATILIVSMNGDGVPLALRLANEGHIVKVWIKSKDAKGSLEGFKNPSKVNDPYKFLDQYDLVINDMVGTGHVCDALSEKGRLVIGGGTFNDKLELDREYGAKVAQTLTKTKQPNTVAFDNAQELEKHLLEADKPLAVKPEGNKHTGLTLVSTDPANSMLRSVVQSRAKDLVPCIVQETVDGVEISTEGWFNGKHWVKPFNHTIERKRLMDGDKGPNTGCMGNVVWATESNKLTQATIEPLAELLEKVGYVGPVDINCIVNGEDAYFLEFTARPGYDALQTWAELVRCSLFDYLYGIASAQKESFDYHSNYAIGIRLTVSPYPLKEDVGKWHGVKVIDVPKEASKHVWLADVMKSKDDELLLAGVDGVVGCVTSRGLTVRECQRRAYRTIKNIGLTTELQYRSDIGNTVEADRQKLVDWGWLNAGS